MCKRAEINVLICSKENSYVRSIIKTVLQIGVKNIITANSDEQLRQIGGQIDIALIDINFNGSGGLKTGEELSRANPNIFILIFSKTDNLMDPIRTIFSGASDFIFQGNKQKRKEKITLWIDVARKVRDAKDFVNLANTISRGPDKCPTWQA